MLRSFALALALAPCVALAQDQPAPTAVRGTVEIASIDENGDVAGIGIWDDEAQLYYDVDLKLGRGAELRSRVGRRIEGTGTASRGADDARRLVLTAYTLLPERTREEPAPPSAGTTAPATGPAAGER